MLQKIYPLVALVLLMCLGISYSTEYRTTEYKTTSYRTTEYITTKYVVSMTGQDFRDYCFSLSDTDKVDFSDILGDFVVAEGTMLVAAAVLSAIPGAQPFTVFIVGWHKAALAGAVADAAFSGCYTYITSNGNVEETAGSILRGGAEGYKWGAFFAVGASAINTVRVARASSSTRGVQGSRLTNFSETPSQKGTIARLAGYDDAGQKFKETSDKYINRLSKKHTDAIYAYSSEGGMGTYKDINDSLRFGRGPLKSVQDRIDSLDEILKGAPRVREGFTVYRGSNVFSVRTGKGVQNIEMSRFHKYWTNPKELVGSYIEDKGFTSTSIKEDVAKAFANRQNGIKVVEVCGIPSGTKNVLNIESKSMYGNEFEVLIGRNNRRLIKGAERKDDCLYLYTEIVQ